MTIYNENSGVPVLYRGDGEKIGLSDEGRKTLEAASDEMLLGHSVVIELPNTAGSDFPDGAGPGKVSVVIGAENLDEALKSVISSVDHAHIHPRGESSDHNFTPTVVASTHGDLGRLLADYYSCEHRDLSEVI